MLLKLYKTHLQKLKKYGFTFWLKFSPFQICTIFKVILISKNIKNICESTCFRSKYQLYILPSNKPNFSKDYLVKINKGKITFNQPRYFENNANELRIAQVELRLLNSFNWNIWLNKSLLATWILCFVDGKVFIYVVWWLLNTFNDRFYLNMLLFWGFKVVCPAKQPALGQVVRVSAS